jgi:hypothetical protein
MASLVKKLFALILPPLFQFLYEKLREAVAAAQAKRKSEGENKAVREQTEKAKTKEERDEAAKDVIGGF